MPARVITPTSCHGFYVSTPSELLGSSFCGGQARLTVDAPRELAHHDHVIKDRFGLYWQINPTVLNEMLSDPDPVKSKRVIEAMLEMRKIIIDDLRRDMIRNDRGAFINLRKAPRQCASVPQMSVPQRFRTARAMLRPIDHRTPH